MEWPKEFSERCHNEELVEKKHILLPAIKDVLKKKKWKQLIDLGCGSGYYCRAFAGKNVEVVGIDLNKTQLDIATEQEEKEKLGIKYIKSDIRKLKSIESNTFDVALLNFVIVEIKDKAAIKDIFGEAYRILKNEGILIVGQVHPHNVNRSNSITERTLIKKGDSYFNDGAPVISKTLLTTGKYLTFENDYHYTLEFILNNLRNAGFVLESIRELSYKEKNPTHILIIGKKL